MIIGKMVAKADEISAMLDECGEPEWDKDDCGIKIRKYSLDAAELYVAHSGAGQVYAAAATQLLISKYGAELIVNFGICGGLTPDMALCRTCVVKSVVHYDFDTSAVDGCEAGRHLEYPSVYIPADERLVGLALKTDGSMSAVICASGDTFIDKPEQKHALAQMYGAKICEMEAAGILLTANRCGVPALLVKAVSDSMGGGAQEFKRMASESARACIQVVLRLINAVSNK